MKTITTILSKVTPNWQVRPVLLFMLLMSLLFLGACSKDDPVATDSIAEEPIAETPEDIEANLLTFNTAVSSLPNFENPPIIDPPEEIESEVPQESGDYLCTTKRYKAAPGYNEMLLLNTNSTELYPGALIQGETILTGAYGSIVGERKPITLSVSLSNLNGPVSKVVNDPANVSEVRQAISEILNAGVTGSTPAEFNFSIENVYSEQQLSAFIGANYSGATVDASGSFDFSSTSIESKIVMKFVQKYYSVDMDKIDKASDLFLDTNLPDVSSFGGTLPNYVSSVNYGRMVLFTATSSYSNVEMQAAFKASYDAAVSDGGLEVNASDQRIVEGSTIKAFVLGGDGDEAVKTIQGIQGVKEFILSGGNYSNDSPGAPLSYTLKNINNQEVSNVVLATEYTARECQKIRSNFRITLTKIDCSGGVNDEGNQQMYGSISLSKSSPLDADLGFICLAAGESYGSFFSHGESSYQTATNNIITIGKSFDVTLPIGEGDSDYVYLTGNLSEYDATILDANENLGANCKKLFLSDLLKPTLELVFNGDGDTAKAIFTILPID